MQTRPLNHPLDDQPSECERGIRSADHREGIDRGSEFVVTLPLMEDATRPTPEIPEERPVCAVRILCVDDNREVVNSLAKLLEAKGHKTQVAYDGAEALRVAPIFRPQMVLLDIDMPGMSGHELASRLRELQLDPPPMLVALTGWGRDTDKRRAEQAGFHRYLVKPATLETLECLLASIAPDPTRCCSS